VRCIHGARPMGEWGRAAATVKQHLTECPRCITRGLTNLPHVSNHDAVIGYNYNKSAFLCIHTGWHVQSQMEC
jgi:hypothetical protein